MEDCHICIIGAGIGAASTAWHLRREKPHFRITVYERADSVGGRLKSWRDPCVSHSGSGENEPKRIELGGAIFHNVNETMVELAHACGVSLSEPERPQTHHTEAEVYGTLPEVGVWDECRGRWALRVGGGLWNLLQLVCRYGWDLVRVSRQANSVKTALVSMYKQQREASSGPYCRSVEEMLEKSGLGEWAGRCFSELGFASKFIAECLDPIARTIYSRGASAVNGYCGLAAVIAADGGGLYSCPTGNDNLVSKLLEKAGVELVCGCPVSSVRPVDGKGWAVRTQSQEDVLFDGVVLACPWESSGLNLERIDVDLPRRSYRQMVVTLVAGEPALSDGYMPQTILSCGDALYAGSFYSMGVVGMTARDGRDIWKVFSAASLSDNQLLTLFRPGHEVLLVHPWPHCFPDLLPQKCYPPMRLAKGCYFANAMEALAPSMEAAAWCGKNVALMLAEEL